ncbi:MAG: hypothetical protein Q9M92_05635 [Enterobacterales bacterium]|nr:hypothetical protein [Enterobacterales bacterium]
MVRVNKKNYIGAFIGMMVLALASRSLIAGEKINKSLALEGESSIKINYQRGNISVIGWDQNKIQIKGELDDKAKHLELKKEGKTIRITITLLEKDSYIASGKSSKLTIRVPKELLVQITAVTGSINISEINGGIVLSLDSGTLVAKKIKKSVNISSVGTNINLIDINATVDIDSVSGKIIVKGQSSKLFVKSVYSNIDIALNLITFCKISNISGNINLRGPLANNGEISISNSTGDTSYFASDDLNARIWLETGPGGDILNQFTKDKPTSGMVGDEKLIYSVGNSKGKIHMITQNGKLMVNRK